MKPRVTPRELESLIDRITDDVAARLSSSPAGMGSTDSAASPASNTRWCIDPLNGTRYRCAPCAPAELLQETPDRLGTLPLGNPSDGSVDVARSIASLIDHTLLKPDATPHDIELLCQEAVTHHFKSVCVNPCHVRLAARLVAGSGVKVCAVVGFPLGATLTDVKSYETTRALEEGATEIDMVISVGMLRGGHLQYVAHDIHEVVRAASQFGAGIVTKVILETCLLTDEEKVTACRLAKEAGASFVKTSTGFSSGGATAEDVRLMRREVGEDLGVKASGGVRDLDGALKMVRSGANRIGASASVAIATARASTSSGY